ncbi:glycosyltransferase family 2 protein [Flammeovirga sp. SJP92]|uniref:glycosyltransferase family 2 protein n=1 Tax=Flammeovirga sp. SJP92 TaxID=1775430 RepID=UPI000787731C|nr:glycosyltransferase family 2 protein [Flammeovirga sp. SJP92]KXX70524.1 hypothetical protein AVL50_08485 [Flammeovirga sp. SJP92]
MTANYQLLFWGLLFVVLYSAVGYPVLLYSILLIKRVFKKKKDLSAWTDEACPEITIIIPAYNEASIIKEKVENTLALQYPGNKKNILFITDGSTDETPDIIRKFQDQGVELLHSPERCGKSEALNRAMKYVKTDIVVCCDANTMINRDALIHITSHYRNPNVGGVCGEKKVITPSSNGAASEGEGAYWRYESKLKEWDAELTSVMGGAGELFSIRTSLYPSIPKEIILDDFFITMHIVQKGFKVAYEKNAYATETSSASVQDEMKRKVRIASGGFQIMLVLIPMLNFFKYGWVSFQYISHRVLRWLIVPFALPLLLLLNIYLAYELRGIYEYTLLIQILAYATALVGRFLKKNKVQIKGLLFPYYYAFMNYCVLLGFFKFLQGNHSSIWEKVNRQ